MVTLGQHDKTDPPGRPSSTAAAGRSWPIPPSALAALTDMGMSDEAIGRYFGIASETVRNARGTAAE